MVKCSYCESTEHNISSCNEDQELVKMIMSHKSQPKFSAFTTKLIRRLSAYCMIKTTLPKIQLIIKLTCKWQEINALNTTSFMSNDTACAICLEIIENTNCCVTKCGHKYCLSCIIEHSHNNTTKNEMECPMCRNVLFQKKIVQTNAIENMNQYIDRDILVDLQNMNNELRNANEGNDRIDRRSFIYDGNIIPNNEYTVVDDEYIMNYMRSDTETTNQFIEDMEMVDNLFNEPQMNVEVMREHYRI
jgi:hypothetical protein